jgi:pyruvate/2-oxoglutarate dehydrogenase complex dihydrolipoamide dehydrogenase (E3) component
VITQEFDVIVLGGGPAGEIVAGRTSAGGLRAVVVEEHLVGGECTFYACMPSKGLLRPAEVLAAARRVPGAREAITGTLDAEAAIARRNEIVKNWDDAGQVSWLESVDAGLVRGHGRMTGDRTVEVETPDGDTLTLTASTAVVAATGSSSLVPPIEGLGEIRFWDSRDVTSAKEVPRRLTVLGGGAVGVEMAQAWRSLGSEEVTIVERADRLLSMEEPFAGHALAAAFEAGGIKVVTGIGMVAARREGGDGPVVSTLADGREIVSDEILVSVGRRPRTEDIGLERIGLEPGRYVEVDDNLVARGVEGGWLYAIGDVNGRALLTHMGKYQGRVAGDHILGKDVRAVADVVAIPRVVFTEPQIASVGLTEEAARERGIEAVAVDSDLNETAGSVVTGLGVEGRARLVFDSRTEAIVGATFTGPGVGDLLHAATIAIVGEVPFERLWHAVPSFPAISEVWLTLLEAYERGRKLG